MSSVEGSRKQCLAALRGAHCFDLSGPNYREDYAREFVAALSRYGRARFGNLAGRNGTSRRHSSIVLNTYRGLASAAIGCDKIGL